ncbi:N-acetylmuramoyl-L-alanine amidase [Arachidicoccus terrestris]|uniref:N-acetylmuramoyl-L-alanine amidase n=1 Tax=Arachidicoccus terrestris TaxID=2875539 RepID=UPI001CC69FF5|nr:N-acetylmuramoyl-L-alanine amidase [Arachidicoccus terrestris]UAY54577.1 N-acetylmuramoyl-L-alanine amidase [Arachidicoccus terrestris]
MIMRKYNLIALSIIFLFFSSCSRGSVPGRIDRLKAERDMALNGDKPVEIGKKSKKSKPKHTDNKTRGGAGDHAPEPVKADPYYVDTAYANQTYERLATAYADTILEKPARDIKDVEYGDSFVGTTNFNLRKPQYVIIHHTAQSSLKQTLHTFTLERTQVSAHYVISRDGKVQHMLNDYLRAWQAGNGKWNNITDMNSCSIGIELDNNGFEPFTDKQIDALIAVLQGLKERFDIPQANFIGHGDYAPLRKNDPNVHFPWAKLAEKGFGYWYGDTSGVEVPADFNEYLALRIIGYDVSNVSKAIVAFRRHFCGTESGDKVLSPKERKILYKLYTKYL